MRRIMLLVFTSMLLVTGTVTASAHSALVSSDPPDGALLTETPTQVTLTFNEELLDTMVAVSVRDAQDTVLLTSVAEAAGTSVIVGWPAEANDGLYRLAYRVVSADGHPVTGEISVTVDADASAADVAAAEESANASSDIPNWVLVVIIGLLVGIAVGLFGVALRRKRA